MGKFILAVVMFAFSWFNIGVIWPWIGPAMFINCPVPSSSLAALGFVVYVYALTFVSLLYKEAYKELSKHGTRHGG